MAGWKMTMIEPTLDDLLEDDIMGPVMRSAGISAAELRSKLAEIARRLSGGAAGPAKGSRCTLSVCC